MALSISRKFNGYRSGNMLSGRGSAFSPLHTKCICTCMLILYLQRLSWVSVVTGMYWCLVWLESNCTLSNICFRLRVSPREIVFLHLFVCLHRQTVQLFHWYLADDAMQAMFVTWKSSVRNYWVRSGFYQMVIMAINYYWLPMAP